MLHKQRNPGNDSAPAQSEVCVKRKRALLIPEGLPNRPWFRHAIYAPGQ